MSEVTTNLGLNRLFKRGSLVDIVEVCVLLGVILSYLISFYV